MTSSCRDRKDHYRVPGADVEFLLALRYILAAVAIERVKERLLVQARSYDTIHTSSQTDFGNTATYTWGVATLAPLGEVGDCWDWNVAFGTNTGALTACAVSVVAGDSDRVLMMMRKIHFTRIKYTATGVRRMVCWLWCAVSRMLRQFGQNQYSSQKGCDGFNDLLADEHICSLCPHICRNFVTLLSTLKCSLST